MAYHDAWKLQDRLVAERTSTPDAPERLLLLEHPHVYTFGSSGEEKNLLMPEDERTRRGVEVVYTDRGGNITYHGPGQWVGYPILELPRSPDLGLRTDFIGYVRRLEEVLIMTLADYGLVAYPIPGLTGVWTHTKEGDAKIAAIGVKINVRGVTKHGFALNVHTDMDYFGGIIPCGIDDKGVISMAQLLPQSPSMDDVAERLIARFGDVFGLTMVEHVLRAEDIVISA